MRNQTRALLAGARVEKDVESAYRAEIQSLRTRAQVTSPFGTDGYVKWNNVRALLEFKLDLALKNRTQQIGVLSQLVKYLRKFEEAGQEMPNVLFVGDRNECFALEVSAVQQFLRLPIDWSVPPSAHSPDLANAMLRGLTVSPFVYDIPDCDFSQVLQKIEALASGRALQVRATRRNIGAMFAYWGDHVFGTNPDLSAVDRVDVFLRCLFYPQEVHLHPTNASQLIAGTRRVAVHGHLWRSFDQQFAHGYTQDEIDVFYAEKDRLIEDDSRRRQGAFFTPLLWVDEAHAMLDAEMGPNWRETCIVWDCAAGTGNLTRDYQFEDLILSTAESADVQTIQRQQYNQGCAAFQYDFLNDHASPFLPDKDNSIPQAVHERLARASRAGKRLVFLMNPPYGTAGVTETKKEGTSKAGLALTAVNEQMKRVKIGASSQQLYAQFMYRCARIVEQYGFVHSTVATFSVPAFMVSGSYKGFRDFWYRRYAYRAGMLFQASHFADVSGRWGVSFTIWSAGRTDSNAALPIDLKDVDNFAVTTTGVKSLYNSDGREASTWVREPTKGLKGVDAPQFSSGLVVTSRPTARGTLVPGSLLYMVLFGNNLRDANDGTYPLSATSSRSHGYSVMPGESFRRATALYAARKLVTEDWTNQKDEYLVPNTTDAYSQWNDDAVIFTALHRQNNCTAMRNVAYKGVSYRIKNHFWPYTVQESYQLFEGAETPTLYADVRGEHRHGDSYLATILPSLNLSVEARVALELYKLLIRSTRARREQFAHANPNLHLLAHDAGLYQLKHLFREEAPAQYTELQIALKALATMLRPGVFRHGFLLE